MNEKSLVVLEDYDIRVKNYRRVRGFYHCETDKGMYLLKEYTNSKGRLELLEKIQKYIEDKGHRTDLVVRNNNNELMTQGPDGGFYILKRWYEHRECEVEQIEDLCKGVGELAAIHSDCSRLEEIIPQEMIFQQGADVEQLMHRHSKELLMTSRYIDRAKNKRAFEYELKAGIDEYYEQAVAAEKYLDKLDYGKLFARAGASKMLCHGNVRPHNILMTKTDAVIVNYIRAVCDIQIVDFYKLFKKVMEKNGWNLDTARKLVKAYDENREVSREEWELFVALLIYPERFWKVANNYINSGKAWLSEKNKEKLKMFIEQEPKRRLVVSEFVNNW
ncbi:MAG: hypothetical protein E7254_00495 [Lachnospiraceae bacterium]|nr:hypothetical protein [Lachnospiraceae bacterium]